jgi:hypothetical protein
MFISGGEKTDGKLYVLRLSWQRVGNTDLNTVRKSTVVTV